MSIHKTEAIVLKKWDFRETSLVVNFYTRDFGKLTGLLKGIRTEPDKFASTLEPFSYSDIVFYKKIHSGMQLVSQCDTRENFDLIRQSIHKVTTASFMSELVDAVMQQEDKNEEVFDLFLTGLRELGPADRPEKIMTIFKIKMLALSGFKPHLDSCVCCDDRVNGQSKFSFALGGLLCPKCYPKDLKARSIFRGTVASIMHIERNEFKQNLNLGMNPEIKKELELILNSFLNFHLEKELKTQKVINKINNFATATR